MLVHGENSSFTDGSDLDPVVISCYLRHEHRRGVVI